MKTRANGAEERNTTALAAVLKGYRGRPSLVAGAGDATEKGPQIDEGVGYRQVNGGNVVVRRYMTENTREAVF